MSQEAAEGTAPLDPKSFTQLFLNGQYVAAQNTETYTLKNPKDGSLVSDKLPIAGPADVDAAVRFAEEAFNGPWSRFTAIQRTECFLKLAALLDEELTPILKLDSLTSGIPISLAPVRERSYIRNCVLYYAGWTDKQKGDYFPADDGKSTLPTKPCPSTDMAVSQGLSSLFGTNLLASAPPSIPSMRLWQLSSSRLRQHSRQGTS